MCLRNVAGKDAIQSERRLNGKPETRNVSEIANSRTHEDTRYTYYGKPSRIVGGYVD